MTLIFACIDYAKSRVFFFQCSYHIISDKSLDLIVILLGFSFCFMLQTLGLHAIHLKFKMAAKNSFVVIYCDYKQSCQQTAKASLFVCGRAYYQGEVDVDGCH